MGEDGKPGEMFRTVRVDPEISELLADRNVTFKGEIESTFFRDLLSWIIPIAIFVSIWRSPMMTGMHRESTSSEAQALRATSGPIPAGSPMVTATRGLEPPRSRIASPSFNG